MMRKKILMSWSSGKDSAWALYCLLQNPAFEVVGLFTTVNEEFHRVSMHGVRQELLKLQAQSVDLPLAIISLPNPCSNEQYNQIMASFLEQAKKRGVTAMAFGDMLLKDVRDFREQQLKKLGMEAIFPLWGLNTHLIPYDMVNAGVRALITCLDSQKIAPHVAGLELTPALLSALPNEVDPSGENGEYHTFVFDGPMFKYPLLVKVGEVITREHLVFADLLIDKACPQ
ncbi:adenine nucleotide alpha hydrolase [Oceanisphaera avium]|uniref:ATP-binding protein n=1 Tax=Oceanisphaera avium TaxID=1903694 RepID=A0A1Y0CVN4_9GAMM|nr:adenine nucleotide alpha hydrolase [Oceanisphaera avium]ART79400.1 ATP-binding protein [Oceanisphaera avium]